MSGSENDTSRSFAAEGQPRSFLQQTTSQLLHQQEALRRRREVLERESRKPPVMRFGLNSPPKSRSPVPRTHSTSPPPPSTSTTAEARTRMRSRDARNKEPAPPLLNQPPLRFSLSYRPTPTPSAPLHASLRTASTSPVPLEVNKISARGHSLSAKRKRQRESRSRSGSTDPEREGESTVVRGSLKESERDIPVAICPPEQHLPQVGAQDDTSAAAIPPRQLRDSSSHGRRTPEPDDHEKGAPPVSHLPGSEAKTPEPPEEARPRNSEFALPQYSPSQTAALVGMSLSTGPAVIATPGRVSHVVAQSPSSDPALVGRSEFPTPRPVARRFSASGLPAPPPSRVAKDEGEGERHGTVHDGTPLQQRPTTTARTTDAVSLAFSNEKRDGAAAEYGSPVPTPSDVIASFSTSAEKRCCVRPTPERGERARTPTAQNLVESVMAVVSSDKRPCGCDRATPSPHSHRAIRTASPLPAPVNLSNDLRDSATTAVRVGGHPAPTPLSTDALKGRHPMAPSKGEEEGGGSTSSSTGEGVVNRGEVDEDASRGARTPSPGLTPQHIIDSIHASAERPVHKEEAPSRSKGDAPAWSPELTEREIAASVTASVEKRHRCGHPTPTSTAGRCVSNPPVTVTTDSASPIPTTEQLLDSLGVTADRQQLGSRADEPAMARVNTQSAKEAMSRSTRLSRPCTPSPVPTRGHVDSSVLASADKRKHQVTEPASHSPSPHSRDLPCFRHEEEAGTRGSLAPPPAFPSAWEDGPAGSPMLTPQHIKDSMQKLAEDQGKRSNAPEPQSNSASSPWDTLAVADGGTAAHNVISCSPNMASPEVTEDNIQESEDVLKEDRATLEKRSAAVAPARGAEESQSPAPVFNEGGIGSTNGEGQEEEEAKDGDAVFSHANSEGEEEEEVESGEAQQMTDTSDAPPPRRGVSTVDGADAVPADSPSSTSDVCMDSSVFKDCVSAAPTPAVPHLPPAFLALQREVKAISEGRSRASGSPTPLPAPRPTKHSVPHRPPTPPPLRAEEEEEVQEPEKPEPTVTEEFLTTAEAIVEATLKEATVSANANVAAAAEGHAVRRGSMELVGGCSQPALATLIQEPHQPMPTPQPPMPIAISVPRTPTPPPRAPAQAVEPVQEPDKREERERKECADVQASAHFPVASTTATTTTATRRENGTRRGTGGGGGGGRMLPDSHYEPSLSPLPRPVTLSSQLAKTRSLSQQQQQQRSQPHLGHTRTPPPPPVAHAPMSSFTPHADAAGESSSPSSAVIDGPTPTCTRHNASPAHHPCEHRTPAAAAPLPVPSSPPREGRSTPYPRGSTLVDVGDGPEEKDEETAALHKTSGEAREDRGNDRTFTVSPQGNMVIFMSHEPDFTHASAKKRPRNEQDGDTPIPAAPSATKRARRTAEATVESTHREGTETGSTVMTPSPAMRPPPASPLSSSSEKRGTRGRASGGSGGSGGRRSTVDRLLEMLPKETQEEVLRVTTQSTPSQDSNTSADAEPDMTPPSRASMGDNAHCQENSSSTTDGQRDTIVSSSPRSRRTTDTISSDISESGTAGSSIAERVAQRERTVRYSYNDYLSYLDEMARSSAKKVRKTSGKRMQQKIIRDIKEGKARDAVESETTNNPGSAPATVTTSRVVEGERTSAQTPPKASSSSSGNRTSRRLSTTTVTTISPLRTPLGEVEISPLTPTTSQARHTGRASTKSRKLSVTTRLSAELKEALFQRPGSSEEEQATPSSKPGSPAADSLEAVPLPVSKKMAQLSHRKQTRKAKKAARKLVKKDKTKARIAAVAAPLGTSARTKAVAISSPCGEEEKTPLPSRASPHAPTAETRKKKLKKLKERAKKAPITGTTPASPAPPHVNRQKKHKGKKSRTKKEKRHEQ